jgi:hypothetical membrane protein
MASRAHIGTYKERDSLATQAITRDAQPIAGVLFVVLAAQFMTVIMLAASIAPAYDYAGGAISDLGVVSETAPLFNLSLLAVGLLDLVGGYLFYRSHGRRSLLALYAVAGIGALGAAIFRLGTSDLHAIFALLAFVSFNLVAIGTGLVLGGPMRWLSFLAGAIGLVFVVLMVIGDSGNAAAFGVIGHGGTERMIVYPVMLWMLVFGGSLIATPTEHAAR